MTSRFTELTVDCRDPERLAAFWCAVLDFQVIDRSEGKVEIGCWVPTAEEVRARQMPPTLHFIQVPEGRTVKNRLHLVAHRQAAQGALFDHGAEPPRRAGHRRDRPRATGRGVKGRSGGHRSRRSTSPST